MGAAAGTGALQQVLAQSEDDDGTVVLEQGDRCVELTPFSGDTPVEELYDYTYPKNLFDGPPGSLGTTYSSMGTTDLQRDRTSVLFLYDGPEGLSLVVVHGHVDGDGDGGTVSFTFGGVPADATWVVRDDYYLQNGQQADSNHDRWDVGGTIHTVDWAYKGGRTDGGVLRGLGSAFDLVVDPAFNDEAALADELSWYGPIESWEALSGDREDPERISLRLDQHVRIRTGPCDETADADDLEEPTDADADEEPVDEEPVDEETTDEEPTADEETDEQTTDESTADDADGEETADADTDDDEADDESEDDRRRTKHERKQEKHRRKHRKKRRKHERKHERKQRKHERKRRKHERGRGNRGEERGEGRGEKRGRGGGDD